MINKKLITALIGTATKERRDQVIIELLNHISMNYDYNDQKASHILEMLVDSSSVIHVEDVNLDYIKANLNFLLYKHEEYNISDIKVVGIDNIDCNVKISFKYLAKIEEDRDDVSYTDGAINISYIDNPEILKNSVKDS